ncbi:NDR1/HIN1-like protein 13 [Rosa sericea]
MHRLRESNPHFGSPYQTQQQGQYPESTPPGSFVPLPQYQGQPSGPPPPSPEWSEPRQPILREPAPTRPRGKHQGRQPRPLGPLVSIPHHEQDQHPRPKKQSRHSKPPPVPLAPTPHHDQDQQHPDPKHQSHDSMPLVPGAAPIPHRAQDHQTPQHHTPHGSHEQRHGSQRLRMPQPQQTNFFTWSLGVCCAIFWILIILAGLIVLIVYLVFRPRTPKFEISTATLNAAYLDMGYLLNADLTVLVNFTNPNKKVSVYFSPMYLYAYYGSTLVATTYIEPFTAHKHQSMFANVHMVASQVPLGLLESQRLKKQLENSRAGFEFKGYFRARANFGSLLRYSYKLHGDCNVVFSRPPDGVMVGRKCKTQH